MTRRRPRPAPPSGAPVAVPEARPAALTCAGVDGCRTPVTHIDRQGYMYCTAHGIQRRQSQPCRQLRPWELHKLHRGEALTEY